ncbi:hypothetical protein Emag_006252 [Eimeria magna]
MEGVSKRKRKHLDAADVGSSTAKKSKGEEERVSSGASASSPFQPFKGLLPPSLDASLLFHDPSQTLEDLVNIIEAGIEPRRDSSHWLGGEIDLSQLLSPYGEGVASPKSWSVSTERASPATQRGEDVGSGVQGHPELLKTPHISPEASSQLELSQNLLASGAGFPSFSPPAFEDVDPLDFSVPQKEVLGAFGKEILYPEQDLAIPSTSSTIFLQSPHGSDSSSSDELMLEQFTAHSYSAVSLQQQRLVLFFSNEAACLLGVSLAVHWTGVVLCVASPQAQSADIEGVAPPSTSPTVTSPTHVRDDVHEGSRAQSAKYTEAPAGLPLLPELPRQALEIPQASSSSAILPSLASSSQSTGGAEDIEGSDQLFPGADSDYYISLHTPAPTTPAATRLNVLLNLRRRLRLEPQGGRVPTRSTPAFAPQAVAAFSESFISLPAPIVVQKQPSAFAMVQKVLGLERWPGIEPAHPAGAQASQPSAALSGDSTLLLAGLPAEENVDEARLPRQSQAAIAAGAPTSAGPSSGGGPLSQASFYKRHLYYRLPRAPHAKEVRSFNVWNVLQGRRPHLASLLNSIRTELVKPDLTLEETQQLFVNVTRLVHFTNSYHKHPLFSKRSYELVAPLGSRLLIADALFCACAVLGPPLKKHMWWNYVVGRMLVPPPCWSREVKGGHREKLVRRLLAAAEIYRRGDRPSAQDVVEFKRALFVDVKAPTYFRSPEWDPWREDDGYGSDTG